MKKLLKILLKILITLVLLVVIVLGAVKLVDWVAFSSFYTKAEVAYPMPGINDGFVQQGFDYVEEDNVFLVAGYMVDTTAASRVYVIKEDGSTSFTQLKKENGDNYTGHTGGIERNGDYVYITGGSGVDVFSYADILAGKESTAKLGAVKTYTDPAYCYIYNGYLLTGSFYYIEEEYKTPEHERMETPSGDQNPSIITVFKLDENGEFGIDPTPKAVISTRRCVQGMCITDDGKIILSTSYGLSPSQLFVYDTANLPMRENYTFTDGDKFTFEGLPLYYLDSASEVEVIQAPPMSEELVYLDGKIYIMNESACNKYIFGKFTSGYNLYAYQYEE